LEKLGSFLTAKVGLTLMTAGGATMSRLSPRSKVTWLPVPGVVPPPDWLTT
jgi:hypothetical protein